MEGVRDARPRSRSEIQRRGAVEKSRPTGRRLRARRDFFAGHPLECRARATASGSAHPPDCVPRVLPPRGIDVPRFDCSRVAASPHPRYGVRDAVGHDAAATGPRPRYRSAIISSLGLSLLLRSDVLAGCRRWPPCSPLPASSSSACAASTSSIPPTSGSAAVHVRSRLTPGARRASGARAPGCRLVRFFGLCGGPPRLPLRTSASRSSARWIACSRRACSTWASAPRCCSTSSTWAASSSSPSS